MEETLDLAKTLHDAPELFPWVVLAVIIIFVLSQRKRIVAYIDARIESYNDKRRSDIVMEELVRNNTAALENNTAALETVRAERKDLRKMVEYHESLSSERNDRIINYLKTIENTVLENSKSIELVEDRTRVNTNTQ